MAKGKGGHFVQVPGIPPESRATKKPRNRPGDEKTAPTADPTHSEGYRVGDTVHDLTNLPKGVAS
jgi:hypothetical protein